MEDKMVICLKCHTDNPSGSKYCMNCGTSLVAGKNKWLAAILNPFIPGLGYLYVGRGKRAAFAVGLTITTIWNFVGQILTDYKLYNIGYALWLTVAAIAMGVIFAWDAYQDAKDTPSVR